MSTRSIGSLTQVDVVGVRSDSFGRAVQFGLDGGLVLEQHFRVDPSMLPPVVTDFGFATWTSAHTTLGSATVTAFGGCDWENYHPLHRCLRRYLSQAGQSTFELTGGNDSGRLKGHARNVHLVAWEYQSNLGWEAPYRDRPALNPDCIDVAEVDFDLSYWTTVPSVIEFRGCDGGC